MHRFIPPAIAICVATYFASNAARQMSEAGAALTPTRTVIAPDPGPPADQPSEPAAEPPKKPTTRRPAEPVHKSLIRLLTDLDDLLDTIHDPASFAAVRPKLLRRVCEQADYAAEHAGQGMSRLSKSAAKELQKAADRHTASLARATRVAPGLKPFFDQELAPILSPK
jgi:hypothetical protein